jgi:hypothetical protein
VQGLEFALEAQCFFFEFRVQGFELQSLKSDN